MNCSRSRSSGAVSGTRPQPVIVDARRQRSLAGVVEMLLEIPLEVRQDIGVFPAGRSGPVGVHESVAVPVQDFFAQTLCRSAPPGAQGLGSAAGCGPAATACAVCGTAPDRPARCVTQGIRANGGRRTPVRQNAPAARHPAGVLPPPPATGATLPPGPRRTGRAPCALACQTSRGPAPPSSRMTANSVSGCTRCRPSSASCVRRRAAKCCMAVV